MYAASFCYDDPTSVVPRNETRIYWYFRGAEAISMLQRPTCGEILRPSPSRYPHGRIDPAHDGEVELGYDVTRTVVRLSHLIYLTLVGWH